MNDKTDELRRVIVVFIDRRPWRPSSSGGGLIRSGGQGPSSIGRTDKAGGSNSTSPESKEGGGQEPGGVSNLNPNRLRSNSFTHRMQHTMMRGIGKVRELIYSGSSYNQSRRSERERDLHVNNTTVRQSRLTQSSIWDSLEGQDVGEGTDGQGNNNGQADMDYVHSSGDNALPYMPPEGR